MILDKAKMAHDWAIKYGKVDSNHNRENKEDAFNAYKEEKMAIALKLINYYKDQVDERVLVSLANVNFSIED